MMSDLISINELTRETGLSKNYIYRQSLCGNIPKPEVRVNRVRYWRKNDVNHILHFKGQKKTYQSKLELIKKLKKKGFSHSEIAKDLGFELKSFNLYMRQIKTKKPKKVKVLSGFDLAFYLLNKRSLSIGSCKQ